MHPATLKPFPSKRSEMNKNELLHRVKILTCMKPPQLERISSKFKYKEVDTNERIVVSGENSTEVYFVLDGLVRATIVTPAGGEVSYQELGIGEMFGELAAIDQQTRTTDVVSLKPTRLFSLSRTDFQGLVENYPAFAWAVLKRITDLNRFLCKRVFEYGALNVRPRIRAELLRVLEKSGKKGADKLEYVEYLPKHQEIANRLATHREAVTREINELQKQAVLKKEGNRLIFLDVERLKKMVWE